MAQPLRARAREAAVGSPAMDVRRAADIGFGIRLSIRARVVDNEPVTCVFAHGKADAYGAGPRRADHR
ncbi:hypothetical protein Sliba_40080 [Streptomyces nigrescens]|uniref:Uncharacterized protein n=1 Tax=Streptomyces nigrescens TaxID=1920 RepID=A0A640TND0_STRNI|nr:hypothetical protein Sliba_40080 [Streptomyces libani subsp. libani]GGV93353.1 hypothetical protein GCM10010500_28770 [Streptomyces libani subsp. libani]